MFVMHNHTVLSWIERYFHALTRMVLTICTEELALSTTPQGTAMGAGPSYLLLIAAVNSVVLWEVGAFRRSRYKKCDTFEILSVFLTRVAPIDDDAFLFASMKGDKDPLNVLLASKSLGKLQLRSKFDWVVRSSSRTFRLFTHYSVGHNQAHP